MLSEELIVTKRQVNEVIREALRDFRDDELIAFFCECRNERCFQAVWLTGRAYDQARAAPEWVALVRGHRAADGLASALLSSAAATAKHERTDRITLGAND